jgi:hypothetical protein
VLALGSQDTDPGIAIEVALLVRRLRQWALRERAATELPIVIVLPDSRLEGAGAIRTALQLISGVAFVDPSDLPRTTSGSYTGDAMLQLGQRCAQAVGNVLESVTPLFAPSRQHVKNALRLKGVASESNAEELIDESIQLVKSTLYRRLGPTRTAELQAISFVKQPRTDADYKRLIAATTEVKWIRIELMRIMPLMFVDGNPTDQVWQSEAAFRSAAVGQVLSEIRRMEREVEEALEVLTGNALLGDSQKGRVTNIGPIEPTVPGASIQAQGGSY